MVQLVAAMLSLLNTCIKAQQPLVMSLTAEEKVPDGAHNLGTTAAGGPVMVLRLTSRGLTHWTGCWVRS